MDPGCGPGAETRGREHGGDERTRGAQRVRAKARPFAHRALSAHGEHEHDAEREGSVHVRPEREDHDGGDERAIVAGTPGPERDEQGGERDEPEQLGTIDPQDAREDEGRYRAEDERERTRPRRIGVPCDECDQPDDERDAQDGDAAPVRVRVRGPQQHLAEPLVRRHR